MAESAAGLTHEDVARAVLPKNLGPFVGDNRLIAARLGDKHPNAAALFRHVKDALGGALPLLPPPSDELVSRWSAMTTLRPRAQAVIDALAAVPQNHVSESFMQDLQCAVAQVDSVLGGGW